MFLKAIHFSNYRAFRSATLPLQKLTLLIGPNGSGKTSALNAIRVMAKFAQRSSPDLRSQFPVGVEESPGSVITLQAEWDNSTGTSFAYRLGQQPNIQTGGDPLANQHMAWLASGRLYMLDAEKIAQPVSLVRSLEIQEDGGGLPAVLTTLQDQSPERFETLNEDLRRWLPEYNRIVFDTPHQGTRSISLRTVIGDHIVPTSKLSAGTLLSLALLSICHLPNPPAIIGLEEPDYGLHPRLLRPLKDSLIRLTSPELFGEKRSPVQVVLSSHSPYLVDLFHDELESIIVTHKEGLYSTFKRMSDLPHVTDILKDAALGEAWYSGILGGVPVEA